MKDFDDDYILGVISTDPDTTVIEVEPGPPSEVVRATLHPQGLRSTSPQIDGTVFWEGVEVIVSVLKETSNPEPLSRLLQLVWATLSTSNAPRDAPLGAEQWLRMKLSLPDMDASRHRRWVVIAERVSWTAMCGWSTGDEHDISWDIPPEWRQMDAGTLLGYVSLTLIGVVTELELRRKRHA